MIVNIQAIMKPWKSLNKVLVFGLAAVCFSSCNEDFPNLLKGYPSDIAADAGKAKVLMIVVDGLRGQAIQDIEPATLKQLHRRSMYTFGGLADTSKIAMTNETGWANLLTGVEPAKHGVKANDLGTANLGAYPTIFGRLKTQNTGLKSVAFTSNADLSTHLTKDADKKQSFAGDDNATLSGALAEIQTGDMDLMMVQFGDVEKAGKTATYESDDPVYSAAVREADVKIGKLVDAVKKRSTYGQENWLVIVTSNKGGKIESSVVDNTVYGDHSRNTYTLFYSPKFAERIIARPNSQQIPFIGNAVRFTYGNPPVNAILDDASKFNFGTDKDFTINLLLKCTNPGGGWNYPIFFAKRVAGFSGNGWNFFGESQNGNTVWGFNSSMGGQVFGKPINDGNWHIITIVVSRSGATDVIKGFTDGKFDMEVTAGSGNADNAAPLAIGKWNGNANESADWSIANVQIYNTAFTNQEVAEHAGITHIDNTHAKYNNLMGYWPGYTDVNTGMLKEKTGRAGDMRLTGPYSWVSFSDVASYLKPPISYAFYRSVPNSIDVPFIIYQWMGVITPKEWALDGKSWTPTFIDIRD